MSDEAARRLLDLELPPNPSGATNVRGYLQALLQKLWTLEANFSGKRPFGYSGWQFDLYAPMIAAGLVSGTLDESGAVDSIDDQAADELVQAAIALLREPTPAAAERVVSAILRNLNGRAGFDHWWDSIHPETKDEINAKLRALASETLA